MFKKNYRGSHQQLLHGLLVINLQSFHSLFFIFFSLYSSFVRAISVIPTHIRDVTMYHIVLNRGVSGLCPFTQNGPKRGGNSIQNENLAKIEHFDEIFQNLMTLL